MTQGQDKTTQLNFKKYEQSINKYHVSTKKNALNKAAAQSANKGHPKRVKTLEDQKLENTKLLTWEK